jgi:hypothetical protein
VNELLEKPIQVYYQNWRGESAWRTIIPRGIYFGVTEYHQEPQWLLEVWDLEKEAVRVYSLADIREWNFN